MLDLKTHTESVDSRTGQRVVKETNPYIRFHEEGGPIVFLQRGKFYGQGRRELRDKDIPDWLWKHIEATDQELLHKCGMTDTAIDKMIKDGKRKEEKVEEDKELARPRRGRPRKT